MTQATRINGIAFAILILVILLTSIGTLFVFQASVPESLQLFGKPYAMFEQHLVGLAIGWVAFVSGFLMPRTLWIKLAPALIILAFLGLLLVFLPGIGLELNGARRWVSIGSFRLQPVEFFKFALITYLAVWLPKQRGILAFSVMLAVPAALLLLQPDLGSLLLILAVAGGMYFISGANLKSIGVILGGVVGVVLLAVALAPYRMRRLTTFFDPDSDPLGASFHIRQIILALGRGGATGQGIGNSSQKYAFIPELSTDSIFAIVGEELGFLGAFIIIGIFIALIILMFLYIRKAEASDELKLFGYGILLWISAQTMLNLSAVVALVPLTGITLPFFSYGRSSLIMVLFATGVFLRIGNPKLWQKSY